MLQKKYPCNNKVSFFFSYKVHVPIFHEPRHIFVVKIRKHAFFTFGDNLSIYIGAKLRFSKCRIHLFRGSIFIENKQLRTSNCSHFVFVYLPVAVILTISLSNLSRSTRSANKYPFIFTAERQNSVTQREMTCKLIKRLFEADSETRQHLIYLQLLAATKCRKQSVDLEGISASVICKSTSVFKNRPSRNSPRSNLPQLQARPRLKSISEPFHACA
jgi:hypothetical protein